jgi:hypothetical protein
MCFARGVERTDYDAAYARDGVTRAEKNKNCG